jgi:hypothetical protein
MAHKRHLSKWSSSLISLLSLALLCSCDNGEGHSEVSSAVSSEIAPKIADANTIFAGAAGQQKNATAPSFPLGKGVIIPAYLTLDDAYAWNVLKEGAATMQASSQTSYKDYWVVVNSADNGPFLNQNDWIKAKTAWDPIRANGGRIFGYVHTVQCSYGAIARREYTRWAIIS